MVDELLSVVKRVPLSRCEPFIQELFSGKPFSRALDVDSLNASDRDVIEGLRAVVPAGGEASVARDLQSLYREAAQSDKLEIVWTGPRVSGISGVRATFPVARAIVGRAQHSLLIAGYMAHAEILDRLGLRTAISRGVTVTVMSDRVDYNDLDAQSLVAAGAVVIDACPIKGGMEKFHVKALVADRREALVTSANFTFLGQNGNVELGVLVRGETAGAIALLLENYAESLQFIQGSRT